MPVEEQVVQIYAATNGYVDRITLERVPKYLVDLIESVRGNEPELLKTIGGGDWSDDTQEKLKSAIERFAEDFGYDLDEEGHPIEGDDLPPAHSGNGSSADDSDVEAQAQAAEEEAGVAA
jgi:F-type H+-transporting ATPase subunit alpha